MAFRRRRFGNGKKLNRSSAAADGNILSFNGNFFKWRKRLGNSLYASDNFVHQQTALLMDMTENRHLISDEGYGELGRAAFGGTINVKPAFVTLSWFDDEHKLLDAGTQLRSALGRLNYVAIAKLRKGTHLLDESKSPRCLREARTAEEKKEGANAAYLIDFVQVSSSRLFEVLQDHVTPSLWTEVEKQLMECGEAGSSGFVAMYIIEGLMMKTTTTLQRDYFKKRPIEMRQAASLSAVRNIVEGYRDTRLHMLGSLGLGEDLAHKIVERDALHEILAEVERRFPAEHEMFLNRYNGDPDLGGQVDSNVFWTFFHEKGIVSKRKKPPKPERPRVQESAFLAESYKNSGSGLKRRKILCSECNSPHHTRKDCFRAHPDLIEPYFRSRKRDIPKHLMKLLETYRRGRRRESSHVAGAGDSSQVS